MMHRFPPISLFLALTSLAGVASAEVTGVDITRRAAVGASGYEKIVGTVHFAVDPTHPHNRVIVDIDKAPVNAAGRVEFSADLYVLRPLDPSHSNGVALVEVVNRGRKLALGGFDRGGSNDPETEADLGDRFLMRRGFTLVWVGWQFDVRRQNGALGIEVPTAKGVSGIVRAEFTPNERAAQQTVADLAAYTPADPGGSETTLTVRDGMFGRREVVARDRWTLSNGTITLTGGFEPGRTYEIAYRAERLPIAGLGMAAFRDVASWIRHSPGAVVRAQHAIAFGSSQSGRFLRTFMYYGFNTDERGAQVFGGVWAHIAGAGRLSLNERGATPNALSMWTATSFPYADTAERDPLTGTVEGLLDNERARRNQPKIFYTNSSVEYWGGGRSAALVHTSPDGKRDLALADTTRVYLLTGTQHSPARFPARVSTGQLMDNPVEYWWTLRALLVAMERWVRHGEAPPASQYPRISDGTLVAALRVGFPRIHGVQGPHAIPPARQRDKALPLLVPQVDEDGNERAGIRTPEIAVPVATYTGWNFRNAGIGGTEQPVNLLGAAIPFARTAAERQTRRDPRRSIEERYPSAERFLAMARAAADRLVKDGYLLAADVEPVMARMEAHWTRATGTN
jgi:hypothetical protein